MPTLLFPWGIARLVRQTPIEKDQWYFGFICASCSEPIYVLDDPANGAGTITCSGEGHVSVPCPACGIDEVLYRPADVKSLQADKDIILGQANPRRKPSNCPRQPLKKYRKAKATLGPRFLEERPECAIIIARCIATWSYIETELALLLAAILKIEYAPALAIFTTLRNSRSQTEIITVAAAAALSANDLRLFGAIMNLKSQYESDRNDLAHGLFG